jgi:molybdopterin molybdotransferase
MIRYEDALRIVLEHTPVLPATTVPVTECVGRALAADVFADRDDPPYTRSAMDGYAVRCEDVASVSAVLTVGEHVAAGVTPSRTVAPGECAKIMTGAIVPEGADAVVMVEDTEPAEPGRVMIVRTPRLGDNICPQGENFRRGDRVLTAGETIGPPHAALLATLGVEQAPVHRLPTVSMMATGNEVVPVGGTPGLGQVRDSNTAGFAAQVAPLGIRVDLLGIAPDDPAAVKRLAEQGLQSDVLAVSAGVSLGDHDFVPDILRELGVELLFETIAVKPGKPTVFGKLGDKVVFGLPGNPVSSQVVTRILVLPALRRMCGHASHLPAVVTATLTEPLSHKPKRRSYRPGTVRYEDGRLLATHTRSYRGSGDMLGMATGNALLILAEDRAEWGAGELIEVLLF